MEPTKVVMKAYYYKHILNFKRPSGTSRGVLTQKETYFIQIENKNKKGIGECGILRKLSIDDYPDYEEKVKWTCDNIHLGKEKLLQALKKFPSIQFGIEQAFISLASENPFELFPSCFTQGKDSISINGLVWMGEVEFMKKQIREKLSQGFTCIKMKIGAIDFEEEYNLLKKLRNEFSAQDIEIRVDANGAFDSSNVHQYLDRLSKLELHSIEQPIKQNQVELMSELCASTPLPIALDEELIGIFSTDKKRKLLEDIRPQYIILKPSLVGGYQGSEEWIKLAESVNSGWWITSALESNIGLNAIAQWTYKLQNKMPQGLGTGALYTNNIDAPLFVENGRLCYHPHLNWKWNF